MKIVVDAFGGDNAPHEIVKGAVMALSLKENLKIVFVGKQEIIQKELALYSYDKSKVEIINAEDVIENDESPTTSIRNKPNSSLVVAMRNLKERDDLDAVISAGNSGAVLASALIKVGRIKGILRPSLMTVFPTVKKGNVLLSDSGVNMDTKPEYMEQFALMADLYAKKILKIENPRVGLLNVGVEADKGDEKTKEAYKLLSKLQINFGGNMESRDYLSGEWDVIIADGFAGNVLNKATEGAVLNFLKVFKESVKSSFWSKIGYLFMAKKLKKDLKFLDFNNHGGALFIGVKKVVIKCHGASKAKSIMLAVIQAFDAVESNVCGLIAKQAESFLEKANENK